MSEKKKKGFCFNDVFPCHNFLWKFQSLPFGQDKNKKNIGVGRKRMAPLRFYCEFKRWLGNAWLWPARDTQANYPSVLTNVKSNLGKWLASRWRGGIGNLYLWFDFGHDVQIQIMSHLQ